MNPSIAANQQRLFLAFVAELRPHVRRDSALPRRIKELLARQRAIGSRDRKLYRELIYTWLRFLPWTDPLLDQDPALAGKVIAWLAPELKATSHYRAALCADWPVAPASLAEKAAMLTARVAGAQPADAPFAVPRAEPTRLEAGFQPDPSSQVSGLRIQVSDLLPAWFAEHCPAAFQPPHLDAINSRANVWVRLQCNDRNIVLDEFRAKQWTWETAADFPDALCLPPNAEVANTDAYRRGFVEIQDLGSQLVLATAPIPPGGRWLDACAGAGGKTLQLARLLSDVGHVDATDIRPEILEELRDRAQRARLTNVRITNIPEAAYDGILVDAPCSGSGTWRRQPHLKWYVKPETISSFAKTQLAILTAHAPRVKPGGVLIYATCSLSHHENHDVVAAFLQAHPQFKAVPAADTHGGTFDGLGTTLLPGTRNTDGFYVATLRASA
ncbi:RsmB/NOP family class I SAM-dependent RNA methyltransferase [Oleiharenicola lentus]|uniref:RsmB/NOP family class I SAM-dependent RNA methyltransferase n=1 Tax=Oleiharenicola lentus TaxID=2508720 RepID=A0A4Q1CAN6_9BACT|nr:RsmB/NOP family class I SAM-dependent RNA methyltransferase [Oleiharenicola lentus]RXK56153.1 RsmB/NOP family class I SAM-dependent RNA methyltransferase [Oleiharenicola lentus]